MSIASKPWNDNNRFNQTGYSGSTLFPIERNYTNKRLFLDDLEKAEAREANHLEFMYELKEDAKMDAVHEAQDIEEEYENEGWV